MLTIRKAQIEALLKSQEDAFVNRMAEHLKKDFPKEISRYGIKGNDLNLIIREGLNSAYQYDIIYKNDMELYIECIAILGPYFDKNGKHPTVSEILNTKKLSGSEKMDKISEYLTFSLDRSS